MSEANKAIVRRYFEEVFNKKVLAVLDDLIASNFVGHTSTGTDVHGPEGVKQQVAMFSIAFPDMHYTLEDLVAEGDKVVARFTFRGTHRGEFLGLAPTGKRVTGMGTGTYRITDGKMQDAWINRDIFGVLQQLGISFK